MYNGGQVLPPEDVSDPVIHRFVECTNKITPDMTEDQLLVFLIAERISNLDADDADDMYASIWKAFNILSVETRLRVFNQVRLNAQSIVGDNEMYIEPVEKSFQRMVEYIEQQQQPPTVADVQVLVESLVLFRMQSATDFEETLSDPHDVNLVDHTELDMEIKQNLTGQLVLVAYAAGVSSADLFKMYEAACAKQGIKPIHSIGTFRACLSKMGIDKPDW